MIKDIVIGKNIKNVIKIICLLWVVTCIFSPLASAGPQSTTYEIKQYGFGTGGATGDTSTTYSLFGNTGELDANKIQSTTYQLNGGLTFLLQAAVPPAPTFTNPSSYYNKLQVQITTTGNVSNALYAIQVTGAGTKYVQADDTLGASPVWQTNTVWGASGFTIIGLSPGVTYSAAVAARQGNYTQTQFGPTASVATSNPTFSFSLNNNALTFPNLNPGGTAQSSTSTVTATVSTNGTGGTTIYAYDSNGGLKSTGTSYTISAVSSDLSSAAEGYGLRATAVGQSSGGPMEKISPYNGAGNNVGLLDSTNKRAIFDSTAAPVTSGTGTFELQARAGNTAKAATDYGDTLTIVASASF